MNVVEKAGKKTGSDLRPNAVDFERFRLRRFIESLGDAELETRSEPVDLAGIAEVMEGNQKAVLFRAAGPEQAELVGNVMGGRSRIAAAFGVKPNELMKEVTRRLRNKPEMFEVSRAEAPCQAVVLTGADADVTRLPVHLQHGADGGPYISAIDRLCHRSEDRLHQCRLAPADAALRTRDRHRSRRAERSAGDLPGQRRGGKAHAGELRARRPSDRSCRRRDADAGRRARHRCKPARSAAAGGQVHHQRHPRAGRRRICHRGLSRREGPSRAGGALRRIPRLLRRGQAQSGVPRHRHHAPRRRAVPDLDHRRQDAGPHRHRAAFGAAHRDQHLARASGGGARAGRGLCDDVERRRVQRPRRHPPARAGRGAQRHRRLHGRARQLQERLRGRSRHRHLLRRADGLGDGDALSARPRPDRDERHAHPAARSVAAAGQPDRRQGRLRPDLAVRAGRPPGKPRAGAADIRRQALCLGRGGARRRPQILRGTDEPRWAAATAARWCARWAACATSWRSTATAKGATSSSQANRPGSK